MLPDFEIYETGNKIIVYSDFYQYIVSADSKVSLSILK